MEIYLHISAGSGPRECEWVVARLAEAFSKEAKAEGLNCDILLGEQTAANHYLSLLVKLSGEKAQPFANARIGTIKWIRTSPFRPNHRRKNWFASVTAAPTLQDIPELHDRDIQYQTMRASGPGGQHVNTTDSAVRATHKPTGISVVAKEERSQHRNKKLAVAKLAIIFIEQQSGEEAGSRATMWQQNQSLERGNEVRTYVGAKFKMR